MTITGSDFHIVYHRILDGMISNSILYGKMKVIEDLHFTLTEPNRSLIPIRKNWAWALHEAINRLSFDYEKLMNPGTAYLYRPNWKKKLEKEGGHFCYCLDPNTLIHTKDGLIKIKDLNVNDIVFDMDGNNVLIKNTFKSSGIGIRIKTKHGFEIITSKNHSLFSIKRKIKKSQTIVQNGSWKKVSELSIGDFLGTNFISEKTIHYNSAYLFGLILSDGSFYKNKRIRVRFTNTNYDLIQECFDEAQRCGFQGKIKKNKAGFYQVTFNSENSKKIFKEFQEFKKDFYSLTDTSNLEFLSGFIEGDGYFKKDKHNLIEICTSPKHAEQQELIRLSLMKLKIVFKEFQTTGNLGTGSINFRINGNQAYNLYKILPIRVKTKPKLIEERYYSGQGYFTKDNIIYDEIIEINKLNYQDFIDIETNGSFIANGIISHNSYGEIMKIQISRVLNLLKSKSQREAIITIWDRNYSSVQDQKGMARRPCTLTLHFYFFQGKLNCHCSMRTSDVMNLLPYDVFHHTLLQRYIATRLGAELGSFHFTASFAYYQKKRDITNSVINTIKNLEQSNQLTYGDWHFTEEDRWSLQHLTIDISENWPYEQFNLDKNEFSDFGYNFKKALLYLYQTKINKKESDIKIDNELKVIYL